MTPGDEEKRYSQTFIFSKKSPAFFQKKRFCAKIDFVFFSLDLGGSTIDLLEFQGEKFRVRTSLESKNFDKKNLDAIFSAAKIEDSEYQKIVITGGHNRLLPSEFRGKAIQKISEIEAIGMGGAFLAKKKSALVVSMGTGTCCVGFREGKSEHIGGTGIGGGSLLGLCRVLCGEEDFEEIRKKISAGDATKVDLSVAEIVGGGIGRIPGTATAANFAKAHRTNSIADLSAGIANVVGQTIASVAVFAARAEKFETIILGGKLVKIPEILSIIRRTAELYHREVLVPPSAEFLTAVGAGILGESE